MPLDPSYIATSSGLLSLPTPSDTSLVNVGNIHPEYIKAMARWTLCRDVVEGEDVVRAKGTLYLPKPTGQVESEYVAYSLRASYTNATGRALDGLEGLIFRKRPTALFPPALEELATDITTTGLTLDELAKYVTDEVVKVGRAGLLVEYPTADPIERTEAEVEESGEHPYLTAYLAENIIDWRMGRVRNKQVLTFVKLREWLELPVTGDPLRTEYASLIRIIQLNASGYCEQWEYIGGMSDTVPRMKPVIINGEPIDYIPFVFLGPKGTASKVAKPPIYDIATKNVHHWQVSADRANAVHWSDCPTPVVIGSIMSSDGAPVETIKLGSTTVLNLAQGSDAKFLEFQGNGLVATKELMQEYMNEMAILLSRILAGDSKAAEAAETAAIHRAGENAVLADIANSISSGFTKALQIVAEWLKIEDEAVSYRLNTNFYPTPMSSQNLIAMTNALIARTISQEEFFEALVAGDVIRPDKTMDQHMEEIASMPQLKMQNPSIGGSNPPQDTNGDTKSPGTGENRLSQ